MPKLFLVSFTLIIFLLSFTIVPNIFAQTGSGSQRLRDLQPLPRVSISPTTRPSTTTTPAPNLQISTVTRPENICKYLIAVYGSLGGPDGSQVLANEFGILYILPDALDNNKQAFMQILKADSNQSALSDLGKLKITYQQLATQTQGLVINKPIGPSSNIRTDGVIGQITSATSPEKLNPNKLDQYTDADEAAFELYKAVYQLMFYANVNQNFFETFRPIQTILKQNGLPSPPFVVLGSDQGGFGFGNSLGLLQMPTLDKAADALGCNVNDPKRTVSGSPLIHVYSDIPINIKLPSNLTYTNYAYSLITGTTLNPNKPLYYEFTKDSVPPFLSNNSETLITVISGDQLTDYLRLNLLPKLNLTDQEMTDFLVYDINPQLKNISPSQNYQIRVYQNQQVDKLLPLTILPLPQTLIRNLIIISPTQLLGSVTYINQTDNLFYTSREGTTVVENGLVLLD